MCEPLTLAAIALTAGSFASSVFASGQVDDARSGVALAEATRQGRLQDRAIAEIQGATDKFTPDQVNRGIEEAGLARSDRLTGNAARAGDQDVNALPFAGSAPKIVREVAGKELSRGLEAGKSFAGRLGRFGAFAENQFSTNLDLGRLGERIGAIGTESRNSANITPLEFDTANRAGSTASGIGDILGSLGSVANLGSAIGFGLPTGPGPLPAVFADVL